MPFTKGNSGNPLGRPKGSLNSSTKEFRELLSHSIDSNKIMEIQKKIKTVKQKKKNPQTTRVRGFFCGGLDGTPK